MTKTTYCEPTTIWRLRCANDEARAAIVPTWHHATLIWWINERAEGALEFATFTDAIADAEDVRSKLTAQGWIEVS